MWSEALDYLLRSVVGEVPNAVECGKRGDGVRNYVVFRFYALLLVDVLYIN